MKQQSIYSKLITLITLAGLIAAPASIVAKTIEISGKATYIVTDNQVTEHANGMTTTVQTSKTIINCDDESIAFHKSPQTSVGTIVQDADGNVISSTGYCFSVDADGDVMYLWWQGGETGSAWGFMNGTGKYEGMKGGGTSEVITMAADGSQMITWQGKWIMD